MSDMNISATRGHSQALKFAEQGGSELSEMLKNIWVTKEAERKGPFHVFLFFDAHFTTDDGMHTIPVPGSKMGQTGNEPYDKYTTKVKTDQGERSVPGSFYTDVVKNTEEGKYLTHRKENIKGGEDAPEDIQNMGDGERKVELQRINKALTDMRTALVRGAQLFLHADAIKKLNPERIKVRMPFKVIDGKPTIFASTIRLEDPAGELDTKVFTVSDFLRMDLTKLKGKPEDQTIVTLENTKSKAPRTNTKAGKGKASIAPAESVEQFLTLCNVASTSIDDGTDEGKKMLSKLLAKCAGTGQDANDAIETIGDFICKLDDEIWTVINARYNAIKVAKAKVSNSKAATAA